jgi:hypothetical protein
MSRAEGLYDVLDAIDDASDWIPKNPDFYQKRVDFLHRLRFKYANPDSIKGREVLTWVIPIPTPADLYPTSGTCGSSGLISDIHFSPTNTSFYGTYVKCHVCDCLFRIDKNRYPRFHTSLYEAGDVCPKCSAGILKPYTPVELR